MSLYRFVYYSAVIGGWAAFAAWMLAEALVLRGQSSVGFLQNVVTMALVGAILGAGLNLLAGLGNPQWKRQLYRLLSGLICGGIGGIVGSLLGNLFYSLFSLSRAIGWAIMGLAIGSAEGIYQKSPQKCRHGAIGGTIGGLLGGLLFDPIMRLSAGGAGMAARATALVILGAAIGALIGLTQLVLKEAWLTVVDGFRPGRELILSQTVTLLGRGDHLELPFMGYPGRDLESEHARITRQPDGSFLLEDNHSRLGTKLNGQPIQAASPLKDGDIVKLGSNLIRFNLRQRGTVRAGGRSTAAIPAGSMAAPPLPPRPLSSPSGVTPPAPPVAPVPPPASVPSSGPTPPPAPVPPQSPFPSGAIKPRGKLPLPPPATPNPPPGPRIPPPPPPPPGPEP